MIIAETFWKIQLSTSSTCIDALPNECPSIDGLQVPMFITKSD